MSLRLVSTSTIALLAVAALAVPGSTAAAVTAQSPPQLTFAGSGLDGGGATSVVAADPADSSHLIAGQDASGLWESHDAGASWTPVDTPAAGERYLFSTTPSSHVAAVYFDPTTSGTVYAAVGGSASPTGGGVIRSLDGGRTWSTYSDTSSEPQFAGAGTAAADRLPVLPRSTGNLLAEDASTGALFAGSYSHGPYRRLAGSNTWLPMCAGQALAQGFIRSIVLVPGATPALLVSALAAGDGTSTPVGLGVWRITDPAHNADCQQLTGGPSDVEEMKLVGSTVWAAAGADGVYSWTATSGWTQRYHLSPAQQQQRTSWDAVTGVGNTLYAGAFAPPPVDPAHATSSDVFQSVIRSTDGGATWQPIANHVSADVVGGHGPWWHLSATPPTHDEPGGISSYAGYLEIAGGRLLLAGRGGVYRLDDRTATDPTWRPATHGLNVTFSWDVAVDPAHDADVYVGDTDWTLLSSTDGLATVSQSRVDPSAAYLDGRDVAVDPAVSGPSTVYVATDHAGSAGGDVYRSTTPTGSGTPSWQSTGLASAAAAAGCASGGSDVIGVGVGHRTGTSTPDLVATVAGCGVFHQSGESSWTRSAGAPSPSGNRSPVVSDDDGRLFVNVPASGVYASSDGGATFHLAYAYSSAGADVETGYLATRPGHPGTVYVSTPAGLVRLTDVDATPAVATPLTSIARPGPIAATSDALYVTTQALPSPTSGTSTNVPALMWVPLGANGMSTAPAVDVSDGTYRAIAQTARGIAVAGDGHVYVAALGKGVVSGRPATP